MGVRNGAAFWMPRRSPFTNVTPADSRIRKRLNRRKRQALAEAKRIKSRQFESLEPRQLLSGTPSQFKERAEITGPTLGTTQGLPAWALDADRDGIEQITEYLQGSQNISGIHVLAHGTVGGLQLGSTRLDSNSMAGYTDQLSQWRTALTSACSTSDDD